MDRVFLEIGPFTIYWYSVLILSGVLIGYYIVLNYCKKINYLVNEISDMLFYLVIWAIIGARSYYVIFNFSVFKDDLLGILEIWRGGLAIYGAIIGGVIYLYWYSRKHKLKFIRLLDIFSLSLLLGQAIGRWGNFFNGEAYGGITSYQFLDKLMVPDFIIRGMYIDGAYRMPTFWFESLWCFVGVIILIYIRHKYYKFDGRQISFYLIWYGIGRFFIEGLRSDSLYFYSFRISQIVSVVIVLIGIIILIRKRELNNDKL